MPDGDRPTDNKNMRQTADNCGLPKTDWAAMAPAWLLSLAIHLLLAVAGSLLVGRSIRAVPPEERSRRGEIVLADRDAEKPRYFSEFALADRHQVLRPTLNLQPGNENAGFLIGVGLVAGTPPLLSGIELPHRTSDFATNSSSTTAPQAGTARGVPRIPANPLDEAAILAEDALIPREQIPTGPTAQLSLFGSASAQGRSFVFVIDRSHSMGGEGLGAIQTAARELATRLAQLTFEQKFQVVAYNESATYLTGRELIPASDENKRKLVAFIANLAAYGQTGHRRGLSAALRLRPEVVFLLTDGGDPAPDAGELRAIRDEAAGRTSIHCIQFGRGPQPHSAEAFRRLAGQNRGSYTYVDMNAR